MARFGENETTRELFGHLKTIPTTGGDIYSAYQHAMRELERNQPGTRGIESTVQLSDLLCAIEIPVRQGSQLPGELERVNDIIRRTRSLYPSVKIISTNMCREWLVILFLPKT